MQRVQNFYLLGSFHSLYSKYTDLSLLNMQASSYTSLFVHIVPSASTPLSCTHTYLTYVLNMFADIITQNISVKCDDDSQIFAIVIVFIYWNYINIPKVKARNTNDLKEITKLFLLNRNVSSNTIVVYLTNPPKFLSNFN